MLHLCIADADRNKLRKLPALFLTVLILDSKKINSIMILQYSDNFYLYKWLKRGVTN